MLGLGKRLFIAGIGAEKRMRSSREGALREAEAAGFVSCLSVPSLPVPLLSPHQPPSLVSPSVFRPFPLFISQALYLMGREAEVNVWVPAFAFIFEVTAVTSQFEIFFPFLSHRNR